MSVITASGSSSSTCSQELVGAIDRGDHLELAAVLEDRPDPLAVDLVVLGDHHPQRHVATVGARGSSATTVVPPLGLASTVTPPPSAAARSAMLVSPLPADDVVAEPAPVVARCGSTSRLAVDCQVDGDRGRVGVLDDVGERLRGDEVGRALDRSDRTAGWPAPGRGVHGDLERQPLRPGVDRPDDAVVVEDRRVDALGDGPNVGQRPPHVVLRAGDRRRGVVRRLRRAGRAPAAACRSATPAPAARRRGCRARCAGAPRPGPRRCAPGRPRSRPPAARSGARRASSSSAWLTVRKPERGLATERAEQLAVVGVERAAALRPAFEHPQLLAALHQSEPGQPASASSPPARRPSRRPGSTPWSTPGPSAAAAPGGRW